MPMPKERETEIEMRQRTQWPKKILPKHQVSFLFLPMQTRMVKKNEIKKAKRKRKKLRSKRETPSPMTQPTLCYQNPLCNANFNDFRAENVYSFGIKPILVYSFFVPSITS